MPIEFGHAIRADPFTWRIEWVAKDDLAMFMAVKFRGSGTTIDDHVLTIITPDLETLVWTLKQLGAFMLDKDRHELRKKQEEFKQYSRKIHRL